MIGKKLGWPCTMISPQIRINELGNRVQDIRALLAPLRQTGVPVACNICRQQYNGCKVIGAHEGLKNVENFDDWYFRTFASHIWCQYHELWKPFNGYSKLSLNRAYLNVVIENKETRAFDKLVSIHCEPYLIGDTRQSRYKRGPHLHVQKAENPIPKCHFPLNLAELNKVLSSTDNITDALKSSVQIICDEVLTRYQIAGI